jgi:hypothetical protein
MVMLLRVGAVEELEGGAAQDRQRIVAQPDPNTAKSSERIRVAVWQ